MNKEQIKAIGTLAVALGAGPRVRPSPSARSTPTRSHRGRGGGAAIGNDRRRLVRNNNMTEAAQDAQKVPDSPKDKE